MDETFASEPVAPASPVRRRRRRPVRLLLVLVLAVLIGRGAGWIGGGGAPTDLADAGKLAALTKTPPDAPPNSTATPVPGVAEDQLAVAAATLAASETVLTAGEPNARGETTSTAVAPPAVPAGEIVTAARAAVEADRFASLVALVETRTDEHQFGRALAALEHLRALPLDAAQQALLVPAEKAIEHALANTCAGIVELLRRGEVLAAQDASARLLLDQRDLVGPILRQTLAPFASVGDVGGLPPRGDSMWPLPKALAKDRLVRARVAAEVVTGRVVDSRSDEVTLRVQGAHGVTYPTVRVVQCEPTSATPTEAVEMGLAALQAGDGLLARLWFAVAQPTGAKSPDAEAGSPRLARLGELLR